jgi:hypothetical protein
MYYVLPQTVCFNGKAIIPKFKHAPGQLFTLLVFLFRYANMVRLFLKFITATLPDFLYLMLYLYFIVLVGPAGFEPATKGL